MFSDTAEEEVYIEVLWEVSRPLPPLLLTTALDPAPAYFPAPLVEELTATLWDPLAAYPQLKFTDAFTSCRLTLVDIFGVDPLTLALLKPACFPDAAFPAPVWLGNWKGIPPDEPSVEKRAAAVVGAVLGAVVGLLAAATVAVAAARPRRAMFFSKLLLIYQQLLNAK